MGKGKAVGASSMNDTKELLQRITALRNRLRAPAVVPPATEATNPVQIIAEKGLPVIVPAPEKKPENKTEKKQ